MDLTNTQRSVKLIKNLCRNPQLLIPYLRSNFSSRRSPLEQSIPWWSFDAIHAMRPLVKGKKVFEYGSGGSTLALGVLAEKWVAIENSKEWFRKVNSALIEIPAHAIHLKLSTNENEAKGSFGTSPYVTELNEHYDIIIIDGVDPWGIGRRECFKRAESWINKEGGVILVDDFWRYTDLLQDNHAKSVDVYESVGPCRWGVTSTALFHY